MSKGLKIINEILENVKFEERMLCELSTDETIITESEVHQIKQDLERLDKLKKKNKKLKEENEKLKLNLHLMSVERLELLEEIEDWKDKYFNRDGEDY